MKTKFFVLMAGLLMIAISTFFVSLALSDPGAGTTLSAYVTCNPHYTRTFNWTIDKSVTPDHWDLFRGDAGTSQFTITVTKDTGTVAAWSDGQICVTNGGAEATQNLTIRVVLKDGLNPPNDSITGNTVDVSGNPVLDPGETGCYDYHVDIPSNAIHPPPGPHSYKVTAVVTITNHSGHIPGDQACPGPDLCPYGPSPTCDSWELPASPTLINDIIHVDDTDGQSFTFDASGSQSYTKTFSCDGDAGTNDNTATIRETGQSDGASVTVNCYALEIQKDCNTSFTRTYHWTIDKSADQSALTLSVGQVFTGVNYCVTVDATYTDSDWAVSGTITVHNPAPIPATINDVSDVVSGVGAATVDCSVSFPYTLLAGGTMTCTYIANLPDASSRINTATATLQNYSYDYQMNATPDGTTDFSGSCAVDFSQATINQVDECIDVNDSYAGFLGAVCYADGVPKTFTYPRNIGPYDVCGEDTVESPASFETNDTHTTGSDSWTINVYVPCGGGCTLTQGYWKTHSKYGPAPYDDNWANVQPNGEDSPFFLSGKSWYGVFWTTPSGNGNNFAKNTPDPPASVIPVIHAYYILAHQYMAAKLNFLKGASSTPAVDAAIAWAESHFFNIYMPSDNVTKTVSQQAISYASLLDQYNSGLIGPGHCSEDGFHKGAEDNDFGETTSLLPEGYALAQNYPNPFNPSTNLSFSLPNAMSYSMKIYNVAGQLVRSYEGMGNIGLNVITWDGKDNLGNAVSSGLYFYKLSAGSFTATNKMVMLK
jgi:hypothetical protein